MGFVAWILAGLFLGSTARYVLPGRAPGGLTGTILAGIGGAVVGGLIGAIAGLGHVAELEFRSLLLAVTGAIAFLFVFRLYVDRAEA
jgi:uncharacterized membrane protein YeaQ/YmgE (transglycosylase-associated protein family)